MAAIASTKFWSDSGNKIHLKIQLEMWPVYYGC